MFSALSRDGGIAEPLKDLAANNPIVNFNYRDILIHNDSIMSSAIDSSKIITQKTVLATIDKALEEYKQDKQTSEFRSLIFGIMEQDKRLHIAEQMKYYNEKKDSLIVGSLGEGETMNMVASIIQQGDDKIKAIKEILEGNSLEDINKIKDAENNLKSRLMQIFENPEIITEYNSESPFGTLWGLSTNIPKIQQADVVILRDNKQSRYIQMFKEVLSISEIKFLTEKEA